MCQHVKILMGLYHGKRLLQKAQLSLGRDLILPVFLIVYIHPVHKMDTAQDKIIVPLAQPLQKQRLVALRQAELHAPADLQPGHLQRIIFPVVALYVKNHGLHRCLGHKIHMICEADFLQPPLPGSCGQFQTCIVAVKGHDGVHMIVKHSLSPPRKGGKL